MDQFHDLPTEDSIEFLYWNVWISYIIALQTRTIWNLLIGIDYYHYKKTPLIVGISLGEVVIVIALIFLVFSLCLVHHKKIWFHIEY